MSTSVLDAGIVLCPTNENDSLSRTTPLDDPPITSEATPVMEAISISSNLDPSSEPFTPSSSSFMGHSLPLPQARHRNSHLQPIVPSPQNGWPQANRAGWNGSNNFANVSNSSLAGMMQTPSLNPYLGHPAYDEDSETIFPPTSFHKNVHLPTSYGYGYGMNERMSDEWELTHLNLMSPAANGGMSCARLFTFRTQFCEESQSNACKDKGRCEKSHCLTWQRRNPLEHLYTPRLCTDITFTRRHNANGDVKMQLSRKCSSGKSCTQSHSKEEKLYHPLFYMTIDCSNDSCLNKLPTRQYFCPFAHSEKEKRNAITEDIRRAALTLLGIGKLKVNRPTDLNNQIHHASIYLVADGMHQDTLFNQWMRHAALISPGGGKLLHMINNVMVKFSHSASIPPPMSSLGMHHQSHYSHPQQVYSPVMNAPPSHLHYRSDVSPDPSFSYNHPNQFQPPLLYSGPGTMLHHQRSYHHQQSPNFPSSPSQFMASPLNHHHQHHHQQQASFGTMAPQMSTDLMSPTHDSLYPRDNYYHQKSLNVPSSPQEMASDGLLYDAFRKPSGRISETMNYHLSDYAPAKSVYPEYRYFGSHQPSLGSNYTDAEEPTRCNICVRKQDPYALHHSDSSAKSCLCIPSFCSSMRGSRKVSSEPSNRAPVPVVGPAEEGEVLE